MHGTIKVLTMHATQQVTKYNNQLNNNNNQVHISRKLISNIKNIDSNKIKYIVSY